MSRVRLMLLCLLIAAALSVVGCANDSGTAGEGDSTAVASAEGTMESDGENVGADDEDEDGEETDEKKPRREKATSVEASPAFRGDLVLPVIAEGTARARNTAEIQAEIAGRVNRVYVNEGQAVRRGQLIAKLDDREYVVAETEARGGYLQALGLLSIEEEDLELKAAADVVQEEFANLERLERSGQITREERMAREVELDLQALRDGKFRLEIAGARSGVATARAQLERARLNLERTEIRAPFSGVLTGLTLNNGEQVTVNEVICTIVDNVNLEAEVGVLEADLAFVEVGKPVLLAVPALQETLRVQVDVVSPQFDPETRTCEVLIRMDNSSGKIRPGMFVRAIISGQTFADRLLVPREAILTRDGRPLLFKADGDRAKWLYVVLGESNENLVEITRVTQGGKLEPGDNCVVSDHLTLAHEAKIRIKKVVPTDDPWVAFANAGRE